jgi:CDP-glucose 4,6-dehydratase
MFGETYKSKRVLVTGHTGFKGSWLCEWLLHLGAEVAGFSLSIPTQPSNFEQLGLSERIQDIRGDVRDLASINQAFADFKPDIAFHLAAQAVVRTSYEDPKSTFDTNLGGVINFLEAVRASPSVDSAIIITSDKCYENMEWEYGYRENDRLGGKDPYSASKACAEIAVSAYWRSFFADGPKKFASTRAGNVIGGGDWARDRIVPDCIRAWSGGHSALIRSPSSTRPWQHVLEPLSGYLWLGAQLYNKNNDGLAGEAFNFGPGSEVTQSVSQLVDEMTKIWEGHSWHTDPDASASKAEAGLLKLSFDRAWAKLGWKATLTFEETVSMTADWYREHYHGSFEMHHYTLKQISDYERLALARGAPWAV